MKIHQKVASYEKLRKWKTGLIVQDNGSKVVYLSADPNHRVPPSLLRRLNLQPNFQKKGGLERTSTLRGGLLAKRGVTFCRGKGARCCKFHQKNKLKSELFNGKKSL